MNTLRVTAFPTRSSCGVTANGGRPCSSGCATTVLELSRPHPEERRTFVRRVSKDGGGGKEQLLRASGELQSLVERRIATHRRRHQEPVALVEDALDVVAVDMRVADRHVVLLAGVDHARHPLEHFRVLVLPRKPK